MFIKASYICVLLRKIGDVCCFSMTDYVARYEVNRAFEEKQIHRDKLNGELKRILLWSTQIANENRAAPSPENAEMLKRMDARASLIQA